MATATDLDSSLELATELALGAGELLLERYGNLRREHADRKGGRRRDLVTEADRAAEQLVYEGLPAEDDVLAEEGHARDQGATRCWVVDPLDGTVNFLHGIPFWGVSMALLVEGEPRLGVVHAPALGQTFTARSGAGCRLNGAAARVSATAELGDAVLATGFAYERNEVPDNNLDNWVTMALAAAGVRRLGSAAIDLAYTACGHFDGFWELHLNPWDVAAGTVLVREAGGRVSDFHGREEATRVLHARHIVASNGELHEQIRERLAPLRGLE